MICQNCGANHPDNADFCPNCGSPVQKSAPTQSAIPNAYAGNPIPPTPNPGRIQERNIALCIIFSIITCGIYLYYWIYCMTEDTKKVANRPDFTSGGVVILLAIVTCGFYMLYWMYKEGEMIDQAKQFRGLSSSSSSILYLVLTIVGLGIVSYALIQNELNNLAKLG
jgi:hypothetical protein